MPNGLLIWFSGIAASIVVAIVTARVTVKLSIGQFRSERWWERKADTYSRIVGALSDSLRYFESRIDESLIATTTADDVKKHRTAARRELERATATGAYIISDDAAKTLERLAKWEREEEIWDVSNPLDSFIAAREKYGVALAEISREAKRDLQVRA